MTTIYTKPQIDAMAVKIGGEIKAAKTTVTQVQGQSTTYAVSQKMITDSLLAFGTAATKNVGEAAGNVMEVGAFGVGGTVPKSIVPAGGFTGFNGFFGWYDASTAQNNIGGSGYMYGINCAWSDEGNFQIGRTTGVGNGLKWRSSDGTAQQNTWYFFYTSQNTTQDANGFLRDSNSIAETVAADATGNVAVASIQAGIGAPKIACKKFVLPSGTPTVEHGLNRDKILDISGVYVSGVERYPYTQAKVNATILDAAPSSTFERHILITYEV